MANTIKERAIELMNTLPVNEPKGLVYEAYKIGATDTLKKLRLPSDDDDKLASEVRYKGVKIIPPVGFLVGKITSVDNTTGINEGMIVEFVKV